MNDKNRRAVRPAPRREYPRNYHLIRCGTVQGNLRAPAYRVDEEYYWYTNDPQAERVTLGVDPECRFGLDATGEVLVYRRRCPAWFPLTAAMLLGWCWVAEPDNCGRRRLEGFVVGENLMAASGEENAEPVELWLSDGTRCVPDEDGRYLFYRGEWGVAFPLSVALKDGWCSAEVPLVQDVLRPLTWNPLRGSPVDSRRQPAA